MPIHHARELHSGCHAISLLDHIQNLDLTAGHEVLKRLKHSARAVMPCAIMRYFRVVELKIFGEPLRDVIKVTGTHCSCNSKQHILLRRHQASHMTSGIPYSVQAARSHERGRQQKTRSLQWTCTSCSLPALIGASEFKQSAARDLARLYQDCSRLVCVVKQARLRPNIIWRYAAPQRVAKKTKLSSERGNDRKSLPMHVTPARATIA